MHKTMKRFIVLLSAIVLSVGAFAQLQQGVFDDRVFVEYEENAQFPGGDKACIKWLQEHAKYPKDCLTKHVEGRVIVSFIVEKDGSVDSIKVMKSPHPSLSKEAIRVVKEMPRWKPARWNNKCIKSRFMLPVIFRLPQLTEKQE